MNEPNDPITELAVGAAQLHELYLAYVDAGFTEEQAMELVKITLLNALGGGA